MTISDTPNLATLHLDAGSHTSRTDGVCAVEAAAWFAGRPHSDKGEVMGPVISAFLRTWNDALAPRPRQRLLLPAIRAIGAAACTEVEHRRAFMCIDWRIRTSTPAWLRLVGLIEHGDALAALDEIVNVDVLDDAYETCEAARTAVLALSWRPITSADALQRADSAALSAARSAADASAYAAALSAALSAADKAAYAAASAGEDLSTASQVAATVSMLQGSALDLLDQMIKCSDGPHHSHDGCRLAFRSVGSALPNWRGRAGKNAGSSRQLGVASER